MKERKCGCIVFEHGPPVTCERHQRKIEKQEARAKAQEEKGLRKVVAQQARDNGHNLARFKEYPSQRGKWTSHCHQCGALVVVYDDVPARGDQLSGHGIFTPCAKSDLVGILGAAEREAIAARFKDDSDPSDDAEAGEKDSSEGDRTGNDA